MACVQFSFGMNISLMILLSMIRPCSPELIYSVVNNVSQENGLATGCEQLPSRILCSLLHAYFLLCYAETAAMEVCWLLLFICTAADLARLPA